MAFQRVLLIANPASRLGERLATLARAYIEREGVSCDLVVTQRTGHAAEMASEHGHRYDAVFVVGGDGTAAEVAGALAGTGLPIGVLPSGTGNLLARALGVPLRVRRAVPALLNGVTRTVDLGRFDDGRRFVIAAGVGIDATMVAETRTGLKRRLGVLAYIAVGARAALQAVFFNNSFHARLTVDGVVYERRAVAVMIANFGTVLGDRITLGPNISTDDGLLDGCVFSPNSVFDAVRIMWRMVRRDFRPDPCVLYGRGKELLVETTPSRAIQADGELLGMTPFRVTADPLCAALLVPRAD